MKKFLIMTCILSFAVGTGAFAEEPTYTETFLNSVHKNIDRTAAPLVDKERELNARQKETQNIPQQQIAARRRQLEAQQNAQQELINKKKQQIQAEKDLLNQQKNNIKNLFYVE